mmetsp:Transcript_26073/g.57244  ORF Transcript_26073/g.57244 Transcript_26073/m.57244 type:complete len:282 (+) Transcript_26073:366-1211(+)
MVSKHNNNDASASPADAGRGPGTSSPDNTAPRQTSSAALLIGDKPSVRHQQVEADDARTDVTCIGSSATTTSSDEPGAAALHRHSARSTDPTAASSVLSDLRDSVTESSAMRSASLHSLPRRLGRSSQSNISRGSGRCSAGSSSGALIGAGDRTCSYSSNEHSPFGSLGTDAARGRDSLHDTVMMDPASERASGAGAGASKALLSSLSGAGSGRRMSITVNKLNTTEVGLIGRDEERQRIRDALARVSMKQGNTRKAAADVAADDDADSGGGDHITSSEQA